MTVDDPSTLDAIVAAYLQAQEEGRTPDRTALLTRHPQWAGELKAFFADCDRFGALLTPLGLPESDTAADVTTSTAENLLGRPFGDYDLIDILGQGGMGVVYRARQRSLGRFVAIKTMHGGSLATEAERQRFRAEAETVAALQHPHIVPLYEAGEQESVPYFSLELIEGGSLSQALARFRDDPRAAARLVATAARAVHHAHQRGVLHRDLKPGNILLDSKGEPHVTDFGLARRTERAQMTLSGAIVGTPEYVAPEQARGEKGLTTAVDVYGLGAVLYATLTGRPPFQGANTFDILQQVLSTEPPGPRSLNPAVPADLETICLKCLRKEPASRYPSAEALAQDLERWLAGEPIEARPVRTVERVWKWVRRRPAPAALLLVSFLAVLALVGAGVGYRYNSELKTANLSLADAVANEQREREKADHLRIEAEKQRRRADRFRYTALILGANLAGKLHDVGGMIRTLDSLVPSEEREDLRSFEWHYLRALADRKLTRYPASAQAPKEFPSLVGSPPGWDIELSDGGRISSKFKTGNILTIVDANGKALRKLSGHRFHISRVIVSDDKRIASAGEKPGSTRSLEEAELIIWEDGKARHKFHWNQTHVAGMCFSPSGDQLAVWFSGKVAFEVINISTGKPAFPIGSSIGSVVFATYNRAGSRLAVTDGQGITLIDPHTGEIALALELPPGQSGVCHRVAFSKDGLRLAAALAPRQPGTASEVAVWNFGEAFPPIVLSGHTSYSTAAFAPDSRRIVRHSGAGRLVMSDLRGGNPLTLKDSKVKVSHVLFSPDGRWIAAATQTGPRLWTASSGERGPVLTKQRGFATRVAFSPDSKQVAIALEDGKVIVYRTATGEVVREIDVDGRFATLACGLSFSPDGKRLAVSGDSGNISVRDAISGEELLALAHGGKRVNTVNYSPDGKWVASAGDRTAKIWDAQGKLLATLTGHRGEVHDVAFTPDSRRVVTTSADRTVRLWDAETGEFVLELTQHNGPAFGAQFSPDGRRLVTTGEDGVVKIIDTVR